MGFVAESITTITERANGFRVEGVFDREIEDLVMKVCCNVLKVSIIIITSSIIIITSSRSSSFHLCLIVRVPQKDVNARTARTRLAKERRAGKIQNKKGPPNVRPVLPWIS